MPSFQNISIRRKQMLIIMLTSTVALLLACGAFVIYDVLDFRAGLVERISGIAEVIADHSTASLDFNDTRTAEQTLAAFGTQPEVVAGCIYDRDGRVFAVYARNKDQTFIPPPVHTSGHEFTRDEMRLFLPINENDETIGTIYVASDLKELPRRLHRFAGIAAIVFGVSLLAALALSSRLQRVVSNPILHLAKMARSVAIEKNYSVRAVKTSGDEIGQLIDGFNEMLGQIKQRDDALQAARDTLERRVEERTNELAHSLSLLNATLNSTADAVVAVDLAGRVNCYNDKFVAMWNLPADLVARGDNDKIIKHSARKLSDPEDYLERVAELQANPGDGSLDVLNFNDGRVVERVIHSQFMDGQRVGSVLTFRDITERRRSERNLQKANADLVLASRQAGMAEVATNVLHNVGNVLNSVNTSASLVMDQVRDSKIKGIAKAVELLQQHETDLPEFFANDKRGRQVVEYLKSLSTYLTGEQEAMLRELSGLTRNVEHIKQIVSMQQNYAKASGVEEIYSPALLVDDALRIHAGALERHHVQVTRNFSKTPDMLADKHKALQILINLISNAKYALAERPDDSRRLTLHLRMKGTARIQIAVEDNGVGIAPENLVRIFSHGFTTKKNGHGFGLHSSFLAAKEMGGSLSVHSDGVEKGAVFTLELPINTRSKA